MTRAEEYAKLVKSGKLQVAVLDHAGRQIMVEARKAAEDAGYAINLDCGDGTTLQIFPDGKAVAHLPDMEFLSSYNAMMLKRYEGAGITDIEQHAETLPLGHPVLSEEELYRRGLRI